MRSCTVKMVDSTESASIDPRGAGCECRKLILKKIFYVKLGGHAVSRTGAELSARGIKEPGSTVSPEAIFHPALARAWR
jgi:hypothetical protein